MSERPNTISGLRSKRKDLMQLRDQYKAEIRKLTVDIDHLDASIKLFDPKARTYKLHTRDIQHKAEKGSVKRFVLATLRESSEPMTSRQITKLWCAERGLSADDATLTVIRKRMSACIKNCVNYGLVECVGHTHDHGEYGPYKLWRIASQKVG